MHTELAFVDNPPEYLMLFCARADRERVAETHLYDSRHALDILTRDEYYLLTKNIYRFGLDANITDDVEEKKPFPIFDASTSRLLRYDIDLYQPVSQEYDQAYDALTQALLDMRISVRLRPGQLIVIDNKRIVHSRSKFKANYDGEDRWLKRALAGHYFLPQVDFRRLSISEFTAFRDSIARSYVPRQSKQETTGD